MQALLVYVGTAKDIGDRRLGISLPLESFILDGLATLNTLGDPTIKNLSGMPV